MTSTFRERPNPPSQFWLGESHFSQLTNLDVTLNRTLMNDPHISVPLASISGALRTFCRLQQAGFDSADVPFRDPSWTSAVTVELVSSPVQPPQEPHGFPGLPVRTPSNRRATIRVARPTRIPVIRDCHSISSHPDSNLIRQERTGPREYRHVTKRKHRPAPAVGFAANHNQC